MRNSRRGLPLQPGPRTSLSARGHFLNTFGGIGFCLASSLLAVGAYLIQQQFANPVQAQSAELVFSALLIATAVTLLYCLLYPFGKRWHAIDAGPSVISWGSGRAEVARSASRWGEDQKNLQIHHRYVDHALVRIQR